MSQLEQWLKRGGRFRKNYSSWKLEKRCFSNATMWHYLSRTFYVFMDFVLEKNEMN
jgi:hypothetical protein